MSSPQKALTAISGGHFFVEWYAALLIPLVPVFRTRLGFSLSAAAALGASLPIVSGLVQILFGFLSDRLRHANILVVGSTILGAAAIALLAVPQHFFWLLLLFAAVAVASAMFHPQGAADTTTLSASRRGRFMSVFNVGGSIGTFAGSLLAIPLFGLLGLGRFWLLALPAVAFAFYQIGALPPPAGRKTGNGADDCEPIHRNPHFRAYLTLVADGTLTATISTGITVLLPLLFQELNFNADRAGVYLGLYSLAGAVANVLGAELSDHRGRKTTSVIGAAGIGVSLLFFVLTGSTSLLWFTVIGFFCSFALSSSIVFGHELILNHHGLVSSSIMGLTWGAGGVIVFFLGHLAQRTSIYQVFHLLLAAAGLLFLLAVLLPSQHSLCSQPEKERFRG